MQDYADSTGQGFDPGGGFQGAGADNMTYVWGDATETDTDEELREDVTYTSSTTEKKKDEVAKQEGSDKDLTVTGGYF